MWSDAVISHTRFMSVTERERGGTDAVAQVAVGAWVGRANLDALMGLITSHLPQCYHNTFFQATRNNPKYVRLYS